ncbi:TPA: HU family DNA-binding protein [Clostridium botulinum]|nr:HU family DNA-binding protein [Clostridium botulinum]
MNKSELIKRMAEDNRLSQKENEKSLNSFIKIIEESLKNGERVQIMGFGTYETRERSERKGKNPRTKEEITIPASRVPVFRTGKILKEKVKK